MSTITHKPWKIQFLSFPLSYKTMPYLLYLTNRHLYTRNSVCLPRSLPIIIATQDSLLGGSWMASDNFLFSHSRSVSVRLYPSVFSYNRAFIFFQIFTATFLKACISSSVIPFKISLIIFSCCLLMSRTVSLAISVNS